MKEHDRQGERPRDAQEDREDRPHRDQDAPEDEEEDDKQPGHDDEGHDLEIVVRVVPDIVQHGAHPAEVDLRGLEGDLPRPHVRDHRRDAVDRGDGLPRERGVA